METGKEWTPCGFSNMCIIYMWHSEVFGHCEVELAVVLQCLSDQRGQDLWPHGLQCRQFPVCSQRCSLQVSTEGGHRRLPALGALLRHGRVENRDGRTEKVRKTRARWTDWTHCMVFLFVAPVQSNSVQRLFHTKTG